MHPAASLQHAGFTTGGAGVGVVDATHWGGDPPVSSHDHMTSGTGGGGLTHLSLHEASLA